MKIPDKIKYLGFSYKVTQEQDLSDSEGNNVSGLCNGRKQEIKIEKCLPQELKEEALIHELFHIIDFEAPKQTKLGEQRIQWLSPQIYAILKNNGFLK